MMIDAGVQTPVCAGKDVRPTSAVGCQHVEELDTVRVSDDNVADGITLCWQDGCLDVGQCRRPG